MGIIYSPVVKNAPVNCMLKEVIKDIMKFPAPVSSDTAGEITQLGTART